MDGTKNEAIEAGAATRDLEAELARCNAQRTTAEEALLSVARTISSPLTGLKSCLRRLRPEGLSEERRGEYLDVMEGALLRLERVAMDLRGLGPSAALDALKKTPDDVVVASEHVTHS